MAERGRAAGAVAGMAVLAVAGAGCGGGATAASGGGGGGKINVVAAENEYGSVAAQIGGRYVHVSSVESNPNTDPHTYEVSPRVARQVAGAGLVIQNGVGYDTFMSKVESAQSSSERKVIDVQKLLGLPDSTPNPHLWYKPSTMPAVASAMATDLASLDPAHAGYFRGNVTRFDNSLRPWQAAIAAFKAKYGGTWVATTEPVADYLLQAMGMKNLTPFALQADIMNGTDPAPQDVARENSFFTTHKVALFAYNQQVTDALTASVRGNAVKAGVPVVGVYETMPAHGYDYQSWMMAETRAIQAAVAHHTSTEHL